MINPVELVILLIAIVRTTTQQCTKINAEYNQLNIAYGEIYRLNYYDYFQGQGLEFTQNIISGQATITPNAIMQGQSIVLYPIIDVTSSEFNQNPYIQSPIYFALTGSGTNYSVLYSQTQTFDATVLSFTSSYVTIQGPSCYNINVAQGFVVLTCIATSLNAQNQSIQQLNYQFIPSDYSQKYQNVNNQTYALQIPAEATGALNSQTQTIGLYLVTLLNYGTINNGVYESTYSQLVISTLLAFSLTDINVDTLVQNFTSKGDYITGFYMTENNLLFVTTFQTGLSLYNCSIANGCNIIDSNIPNPFPVGTLGISVYNVGYSQNNFYIALTSASGIVSFIYNINLNSTSLQTQQIIRSSQITQSNMFQTQVFINPRYIVVTNELGINVYPSRFNEINKGQLLFSYNSVVVTSAYDLYNNILVAISTVASGQNVSTYQFNNPVIYIAMPQNNSVLSVSANVPGSKLSACEINFTMITQTNPTTSNQAIIYNSTLQTSQSNVYNQLGPQFTLVFGSQQLINLNQWFIGPGLVVNQPYVQPAISSDISTNYQQVLEVPVVRSQYKINTNLITGSKILLAQNFFDPSFITVLQGTTEFKDSFLQLVQVDGNIILYQCQGMTDTECQQLYYVEIYKGELVTEFALGFQYNQITFAYRFVQSRISDPTMIQFTTIEYSDELGQYVLVNSTQMIVKNIIQIGIASSNIFVLYSDGTGIQSLSALEVYDLYSTPPPQWIPILQNVDSINAFYFNVPAYGDMIFVDTGSDTQGQITLINLNLGQVAVVGQVNTISGLDLDLLYGLTLDGVYVINTNPNDLSINFYPRVELIPVIYNSVVLQPPFKIHSIQLPVYGVQQIQRVKYSTRFLYVMVQQYSESSSTIFVYRNTQTILNSLYYVINASYNEFIQNGDFSVVSALEYDAILFKSSNIIGYKNSHLLPEYEISVKCNLNSNAQYQIEYNYLQLQAGSLLQKNQMQPEWASFQILNLVSFVSELSTVTPSNLPLTTSGILTIDPRQLFSGNIGNYILGATNPNADYYFTMQSTMYVPPQQMIYQNPVTAVSTMMTLNAANQPKSTDKIILNPNSLQDSYYYTFVQTNRVVLITPYVYYTPTDQHFIDNSTISIDYPLSYKLPVLDPQPNSQQCPLIFVDQFSQGVVSVCGTTVEGVFLASFTIFNTQTQLIQETQIIDIQESFQISGFDVSQKAKYQLISGTYLDIGVVVLTYRYVQNIGATPPTDIIVSFAYSAYLEKPTVNDDSIARYQLIQPINQVWYVPNQEINAKVSVSVFTLSPQSTTQAMYGLLCVSNLKEECLSNTIDIDADQYSGTVITINYNTTSLSTFFIGSGIVIDNITATTPTHNVILTTFYKAFDVSIINVLSTQNVNSISQIMQANSPKQGLSYTTVPMLIISSGDAYIVNLEFQSSDGQFIQLNYACTLMGLTNQNTILSASVSGGQIVLVVSNPSPSNSNQVTLLNYGLYNNFCSNSLQQQLIATNTPPHIVTAIGSYSYLTSESVPVVTLMSTQSNIPRTLISNQGYAQLLNTNYELVIQAFPNYNLEGGVTLNQTALKQNDTTLYQQLSATPINTYVSTNLIGGSGGSITLTLAPNPQQSPSLWGRKIWGQFIWGTIMFGIIVGVLAFLFYKSQSQGYDYQ